MFQIYLPIAELSVSVLVLLAMGGGVGFLSGLFGIGGGFLLTPLLIFIGVPPGIAVGTQANQAIASSTAGMLGHRRKRNVDVRLGCVMLLGGALGTLVGSALFGWFTSLGQVDFIIAVLYVVFLGGIGVLMLYESLRATLRRRVNPGQMLAPRQVPRLLQKLPFRRVFPASSLEISLLIPVGIGFVAGITTVLLGLGGSLLVPAMIYVMAMPAAFVAGTSLFQVMFTSIAATFFHATTHHTVDLVLALPLMLGSVLGAQVGTRFAGRLRPDVARLVLAIIVLGVALRLFVVLTVPPEMPFAWEAIQP